MYEYILEKKKKTLGYNLFLNWKYQNDYNFQMFWCTPASLRNIAYSQVIEWQNLEP